ncbi:MAG: PEP-CTERM sorting domain-containing protein [Acidobacteriota bacterium]|nr:PEP-CTERM sorting domain-containing protein [Acidobacteriota bacterium]
MKTLSSRIKSALLATVAVGAISGNAQAAISQVITRAGITETDFIAWATIATQMGTSSPSNFSGPAAPLGTVTTNNGVGFGFSQTHFGGQFNTMHFETFGGLTGTALAGENGNSNFIDLIFSSPFQTLGFDFQGNDGFGSSYSAILDVFGSGATSLGTLTFVSPGPNQIFVGVHSTAQDIFEIHIRTTGATPFAFDRVSLTGATTASTPEPGTFGLLLIGSALVFGYTRKRSPKRQSSDLT